MLSFSINFKLEEVAHSHSQGSKQAHLAFAEFNTVLKSSLKAEALS